MGELLLALDNFRAPDGDHAQAGKIDVLGTSCLIVTNILQK
jgi:hypothetical protein